MIDAKRSKEREQLWMDKQNCQRDQMIAKYKKRILTFIDKIAKKPREKADDYSKRLEKAERSFYRAKILGDESIRLTHKFETARVKEAEEKHKSILDTVPSDSTDKRDPLNLRPRDKDKEIVPPYRQQPRAQLERLYDSMTSRGLSNNTEKIALRSFEKSLQKYKKDPALTHSQSESVLRPKAFLPELHDKTHFKAAYTIMLNSQSCLQDDYGRSVFLKHQLSTSRKSESKNISLSRFNKTIAFENGLSKLPNQSNLFRNTDTTLNDRDLQRSRTDDSLLHLLNDLNQNPKPAAFTSADDDPLESLIASYKENKALGRGGDDTYLESEEGESTNRPKKKSLLMVHHMLKPHEEAQQKPYFDQVQSKTLVMMQKCNYTRRKHFKSSTLRYGEGSLFMNKGVSNKEYESSILKKSLQ